MALALNSPQRLKCDDNKECKPNQDNITLTLIEKVQFRLDLKIIVKIRILSSQNQKKKKKKKVTQSTAGVRVSWYMILNNLIVRFQ